MESAIELKKFEFFIKVKADLIVRGVSVDDQIDRGGALQYEANPFVSAQCGFPFGGNSRGYHPLLGK